VYLRIARTTIEICTAILAACIPCFKPLFKAVLAGSSAQYASPKYKNSGYVRNKDSNRSQTTQDLPGTLTEDVEMYARTKHNANPTTRRHRSDGESEESFIAQDGPEHDGALKGVQVIVSMDESQQPRDPKSLV
jgi:hypothetical protein